MKCGRLGGWLMLVVLFLFVGGCFSSVFAAGAARGEQSSQAAELAARAPKTPEEFLRLVRAWMDDPYMDDPYMDAYTFIERLSGVSRGKWKEFPKSWSAGGRNYSYDPFDSFEKTGEINPVPYDIRGIQITPASHLWDIIIPFPDKSFCVSAGLVRDILGEPSDIDIRLPNKYSNKQPYKYPSVYYQYKTDKYLLDINFKIKQYRRNEIISMDRSRRRELFNMISKFEFYRNICAGGIRFGTYEGR